ncbi:DUF6930 domain-containing protein [Trichocoleus sp. FACHB-262]|uniref:DUF6930 domain-containing protein n=1 Tax=Trichocoleus sp. FACHB-262 TaxID=2692869 RepID=UPI001686D5FC|nr:hypothetical protein [Trichocoleus sp. FACHB-262]MBD2123143.1 hypothetical protein [Trichocoleus sp. FACHB-262]
MTTLTPPTCRRLQNLQQIPSVWEGDRRPLTDSAAASVGAELKGEGECILWVDGSQAVVRAMDIVPLETGAEAVVRALLQAMEHPHSPALPGRPQKIVVRDRELQFFLRGVLQNLDIVIDYVPDLPLIDEIFKGFQEAASVRPPQLPPAYAKALTEKAYELWDGEPWEILGEHQILAIEINQWDVETLYACVMGMMGMEYGILLYRSLDSLKQFRQQILNQDSSDHMESAFLKQDCMFITFEQTEDETDDETLDLSELPPSEVQPSFGNLHPLERMRSYLYEEEAIACSIAAEALHRFFRQHGKKLSLDHFPAISSRYRIPLAELGIKSKQPQLSVQVSTLPDVAAELAALTDDEDEDLDFPVLRDDLVPKDCLRWLEILPWETVELLRKDSGFSQLADTRVEAVGEGLPVVFIQTSQPKAKALIQGLEAAGGLNAICFNPGEDPFAGTTYDLGVLQTNNGELHLFEEFIEENAAYTAARKKWERVCKKTKGYCGLVIAKGVTGASRGKPPVKDMLALMEARSLSAEELGIGPMELKLEIDWV